MARTASTFATIRTEGSLLPTDFLQRLLQLKPDIDGLRPEDYHLVGRERIDDAVSRAWLRLFSAWTVFRDQLQRLSEDDTATTITREKWLYVLFSEFGYGRLEPAKGLTVEGKPYPISHVWRTLPLHLVGANIDLDKRTRGAAGAATMSPHGLVQEYLNRSDEHLWGVVSNGRVLRILRDNAAMTRQAYIEFDLEAMFEGQEYHDFVLLWMLLHRSRFEAERPEQCWLEQWLSTSRSQGTRALDALRGGVEAAITALGTGLVSHRGNAELKNALRNGSFDKTDLYREVLRIVYQLIFLFAAEDRELVFAPDAAPQAKDRYRRHYSVSRLRWLAQRKRGDGHTDLWQQLLLTFNLYATGDGEAVLGIPYYGGLFRSTSPLLMGSQIANLYVLEAIRALTTVTDGKSRRRVDYRNMGAEELGSVYESLLEQHPDVNLETGSFSLGSAAGSERKTTGSYYTPASLITLLLDSALDPVLAERIETARKAKRSVEEAILEFKVCDPACGSGHFLIAAAHRIARELAKVRTGDDEPSPAAQRHALRDVVSHCIYGVDINPMAVELTKVGLWLEAIEPGKPLTFLDHHIKCGNSLLGATPTLIDQGIPDQAFVPVEGDDRSVARSLASISRARRSGQGSLLELTSDGAWIPLKEFADLEIEQEDASGVQAVAEAYANYVSSEAAAGNRLRADAWVAAFLATKQASTRSQIEQIVLDYPELTHEQTAGVVAALLNETQPLHWDLEFPAAFSPEGGKRGFDVLVGNPPYGSVMSKWQRNLANTLYATAAGTSNAAADFIEACGQLCRDDGRVGLVVPKSLTYSYAWRGIRNVILPALFTVVDCGKAWDDVLLEQVIVVYGPKPVGRGQLRVGRLLKTEAEWSSSEVEYVIQRFSVIPTGLHDGQLEVLRAIDVGTEGTLGEILKTRRGYGIQRYVQSQGEIPAIGGRSIRSFAPLEPLGMVCPVDIPRGRLSIAEPGAVVFQNIVAHLTRPAEHLKTIGTVCDRRCAVLDTVNLIDWSHPNLTARAICALLMSRLMRWLMFEVVYNRAIRTMHFDNYFLEKLPCPPRQSFADLAVAAEPLASVGGTDAWRDYDSELMRAFGVPEGLWSIVFDAFEGEGSD